MGVCPASPDQAAQFSKKFGPDAQPPPQPPMQGIPPYLQRKRAAIGLQSPEAGPSQFTNTPSRPAIQKAGTPLPATEATSTGDLSDLLQKSIDSVKSAKGVDAEDLIPQLQQ